MKGIIKGLLVGFIAAALVPALRAQGQSAAAVPPPPPLTLPAGSILHVRLTTTLTSKTNKTGDKFTGVVNQPIMADGKTILPQGSLVDGHVTFVKPPKHVKGRAQMRIVLDDVVTPDNAKIALAGSLEDAQGSPCAKTEGEEGTIKGCGKSKKDAAKDSAIGGAIGAGAGASVGLGHEIECQYYGNCGGPGFGTDVLAGAGIGAGTVLIYNLFKKEKDLILIEGTDLTFVINRSVEVPQASDTADDSPAPSN